MPPASGTSRSLLPGSPRRLALSLLFLVLLAHCAPPASPSPPPIPSESPPAPMFVADLGAELRVEDLDAALLKMDFVEDLGGFISAVGSRQSNGSPSVIVELRLPRRYAGRAAEILSTGFGTLTSINVLSGEVNGRHARLVRRLQALEQALPGLSGAELRQAKDEIELLEGILAFQLRRTEYLCVEVHLTQAP